MKNKRIIAFILLTLWIGCTAMAIVDGVIRPPYLIKSMIKVVFFLGLPLLVSLCGKNVRLICFSPFPKKGLYLPLALGGGVFLLILGGYFLLQDTFDFSGIPTSLTKNVGVTKDNFFFVAIYISIVNSWLEEFFFRGFAFLTLKQYLPRMFAHVVSAFFFAFYHIAIMTGWFSPALFVLTMAALFAGGIFFNYLDEKINHIFPSWIVHLCANLSINTIGLILFGIY